MQQQSILKSALGSPNSSVHHIRAASPESYQRPFVLDAGGHGGQEWQRRRQDIPRQNSSAHQPAPNVARIQSSEREPHTLHQHQTPPALSTASPIAVARPAQPSMGNSVPVSYATESASLLPDPICRARSQADHANRGARRQGSIGGGQKPARLHGPDNEQGLVQAQDSAESAEPNHDSPAQGRKNEASGKQPSGSCGIGVQLVKCRNGDIVVLSVREGSSAEEAGVGAGDRIVGVGSSDISGQGLDCKQVGEVLLPHEARSGLPH